jgi:cytochrome c551
MNTNRSRIILIYLGLLFSGCSGGSLKESVKLNQYIVEGMQLYRQHCANCHQVEGTGLARLIPPLNQSDYLQNMDQAELACQIRYGLSKEIVVNEISYNQVMPGIPKLRPLEIAEIVTYVKNTWSLDGGLYGVKQAEKDLVKCKVP